MILFILSTCGLTYILTRSKVFKSTREGITRKRKASPKNFIVSFFDGMLGCYACTGFWAGGIIYGLQLLKIDFLLYMLTGSIVSLTAIEFILFLKRK